MTTTLIQMTIIMACGVGWRLIRPAGLTVEQTRLALTSVVYYVFLPALVLDVLMTADMGIHTLELSFLGVSAIFFSLLIIWIICRVLKFPKPQTGAILLAASFPNVTYLGLPVLEQTYGAWARSVAIQLDLFAVAPLVFTAGILIARHYGTDKGKHRVMISFLNTPPFWAALLAVVMNLSQASLPWWSKGLLPQLSAAVVPLMLFSVGLALNWKTMKFQYIPYIIPIILIQLFLIPWYAREVLVYMSMTEQYKTAAVMDLAMPSMVLGIVFCDRYKLDSSLYAMAVTVTTLASMFTLPFWHNIL